MAETREHRALRILRDILPQFKSCDQAIENLYYMDPDNDLTRLPSIAAALHVLGVFGACDDCQRADASTREGRL